MASVKIKIVGTVLELFNSSTAMPIQPIHRENGPNGLNWQYFLAGSSKMAPTILILSIALRVNHSFELISIVHWVLQFFIHNISILGRVLRLYQLYLDISLTESNNFWEQFKSWKVMQLQHSDLRDLSG